MLTMALRSTKYLNIIALSCNDKPSQIGAGIFLLPCSLRWYYFPSSWWITHFYHLAKVSCRSNASHRLPFYSFNALHRFTLISNIICRVAVLLLCYYYYYYHINCALFLLLIIEPLLSIHLHVHLAYRAVDFTPTSKIS